MDILEKSLKLVNKIFTKENIGKLKSDFRNYIDRVNEKSNSTNQSKQPSQPKQVNRTEEMGNKLKCYESSSENILKKDEHIIIRIDGHHFSTFTKGFKKPFDNLFREAMIRTTEDLHNRFNSYTSYTQSDEITLYIPAIKPDETSHPFGGRTQKIASLASSYTTIQFNKHLNNLINELKIAHHSFYDDAFKTTKDEVESSKYIKILENKINTAYFDARVFSVPDIYEVTNVFIWRGRDCVKNSKSTFARAYVSHKELLNKNSKEQILYVREKYNKDWNLCEDLYKFGTLIKKELYEKETDSNFCTRSRLKRIYLNLSTYSEDLVNLIKNKCI